ncbi:MAG: hypothetical protein AB1599_06790 [Planctomycetota bacterium]
MNYQTSWQDKVKQLPEEIFSRLEQKDAQTASRRALLTGKGSEFFLPGLNKFLPPSRWKLFVSNGKISANSALGDNLIYLKGQSITHLTSFPDGIFDLAISLWDLPSQNPDNISYMNNLCRLLKKSGQLSIIAYLDGSPELPLDIIKEIIRRKKLPLKIFKSALPGSTGDFRKMLNKAGFGDVRIWKDNIACIYKSADELYDDIFPDISGGESGKEGNIFTDSTTDEQRTIIKEEFIRDARKHSFPLEISYDFAGGVGVKP